MTLERELREFFGHERKLVVVMGVGSFNGDDRIGPHIIELLEKKPLPNVILINAEIAPENFAGKIAQYNPSHVLIIDAADFHGVPGQAKLIPKEKIGGIAISTHTLPLDHSIYFIESFISVSIILLGIQPFSISFWAPLSEQLEAAAVSVADTLYQILSE